MLSCFIFVFIFINLLFVFLRWISNILLPLPPGCQNYRHEPLCPDYLYIYIIYISKICASEPQVPHSTEAGLAMQLKAQKEDSQKLYPQRVIEENSRRSRLFQGSWGLPAESQLLGSFCREPVSVKEAVVAHFRHFSSIVRWVHQTAEPPPTPLLNLHSLHQSDITKSCMNWFVSEKNPVIHLLISQGNVGRRWHIYRQTRPKHVQKNTTQCWHVLMPGKRSVTKINLRSSDAVAS